jgi:serine/threonine protein kinase/tetratricopeptide (TPR) repeat protein
MARAATFAGTDRFKVLRAIGQGGCGIVYEAFDRERRARVALKTLNDLSPAALYRFKKEFRALGDLTHDNLVSLYELMSDGDGWFFTMELVAGVDVLSYARGIDAPPLPLPTSASASPPPDDVKTGKWDSWTDEPKPQPAADLGRLRASMAQLAEGLHALHGAGKLHRDVKPSNVLVTKDGRVVVLDFGIATELGTSEASVTDMDAIIGTPAYMAPEQGAGDELTEAADWYAMGVILYEALTGRRPFVGASTQVLLDKQRYEPPRVRDLSRGAPEDLEALCGDLLRRDPRARPRGPEVLRRLGVVQPPLRRSVVPMASQTSRLPLVGRDAALGELHLAYDDTRRGLAVTAFVHGTSGMGKSALVRRFLEDVAAGDGKAIVLSGRCYERESVPYKAFDTVIDALMRNLLRMGEADVAALVPTDAAFLARLFPVLERVPAIARAPRRAQEVPDPQQLRRRAFAALRDLLVRLSDRRPVVIFIDDVQWGDADSAALLADLTAPPDAPPILIVLGYRSDDALESAPSAPLLPLLTGDAEDASADRRVIAVDALAPTDARALAMVLLAGGSSGTHDLAAKIAAESGGNPFFLGELVRYVQADLSRLSTEGLTLEKVLRQRVGELPDAARSLLEALCVAGRPLRLSVALTAANLGHEEGRQASAVLRVGNLARAASAGGETLEPYHDRIRETVLATLTPARQTLQHAALVRAITEGGDADPEMLFVHSRAAGLNDLAAKYAEAAAAKASSALAFDRAAQFYRLAIEVIEDAVRLRRLRASLGDAYANGGRSAEAARAYLSAIDGASAAGQLELRRRAAEQLLFGGHLDEGRVLIEAVLADVGMRLSRARWRALVALALLRTWLFVRGLRFRERDESTVAPTRLKRIDVCWSVAAGLGISDTIRGAEFAARNLLYALDAGEPWRLCRAITVEAGYIAGSGGRSYARAMALAEVARRLAERVKRPDTDAIVEWAAGWVPYFAGQWKVARTHFEESMRIYRDHCTGTRWELDTIQLFHLFVLYLLGDFAEYTRLHPRYLREAHDRGDRYLAINLDLAMVHPSLLRDDPATARAAAVAALAKWSQSGFHVQDWFQTCVLSRLDFYEGRHEDALARIDARWAALRGSFLLRIQLVRAETRMLHGAAALGSATGARREARIRVAEKDARALLREKMTWIDGYAFTLLAGVARKRGDQAAAVSYLEKTISAFERTDMTGLAAGARFRLGEIVGGDRGQELVATARAWMVASGMKNPEAMVRVLLPGLDP